MAFLDNFVIPEQKQSIESTVTGGGRSSASFLGNFVLPEDTARAEKIQSIKESSAELRRQAEAQGSIWGMTKTFAKEMTTVPVADFISGAKEGIKATQAVEPEKIFDIPRTIDVAGESLINTWNDAGNRAENAVRTALDGQKSLLQKGIAIGEAGMGAVGIIFSPITTALAGASTVPVIGHVADKVNELFAALGGGASKVATEDIVEKLPISRTTKDTVKPLVGEVAALIAQVAAGKGSVDLYTKIASKTKELNSQLHTDAISKVETPSDIAPKGDFLSEFVKPEKPVEQIVAPKEKVVTKEAPKAVEEPLVSEARKYKTAEEFVKAQSTIHRGDTTPIKLSEMDTTKVFNPSEKEALSAFNNTPGLYFTDSVSNAKSYGKNITSVSIEPSAKVINVNDAPKILKRSDVEKIIRSNPRIKDWATNWSENFDQAIKQITDSVMVEKNGNEFLKAIWSDGGFSEGDFVNAMKKAGIDGITVPKEGVNHFVIYNKDVLKTKSQLTDIWKKAQTVAGEQGISKVAKSVEAKAIEQGLTKGFGEVAGYEKITIKDQAQRAADVMSRDFEYATRMVKGEVPMESGLKAEMLIKAMEDHAIKTKDVKLLQDIANSPLTSETSVHAQALRILAERDPESAVVKMREVRKAREEVVAKKMGKTVEKAKSDTVKEVKKAKDSKKVTKQSWQEFISELKCNY